MGVGIKFNEQNLSDKNLGKADFVKIGYINYIQGDANSWIDTEFSGYRDSTKDIPGSVPEDTPKIQITFLPELRAGANPYDNGLFGVVVQNGTNNQPICLISAIDINITGKGASGIISYEKDQKLILEYGSVKSKLNDIDVIDNSNGSNQYRINAYENSIKLLGFSIDGTWKSSIHRIYDFKAYVGDSLVKHLRPYRKSDGTVCMIDELTKTFYYNKGTGVLIGG